VTTPAADPKVRRSGLGGTDVAKVLGVSRFGTPMSVWSEKMGYSAPLIQTEPMAWGLRLEDAIAQHWSREMSRPVFQRRQTVRVKGKPFLMAHLDRLVGARRTADAEALLEVKNADRFRADDFGEQNTDEVPPDYFLQGLHQAAVTDKPRVHFAVLIGGNHFRKYVYERDLTLERPIEQRLEEWWQDHIVKGIPPEVDGSESSFEYLRSRYPVETLPETEWSEEIEKWALIHQAAHEAERAGEAEKALAKNMLRDLLGGAGTAQGNGITVRWTTVRGARRFRLDELLKARPDLAPVITEFTTPDPDGRRLTVTVKEQG
jgi:putative phage-type endonuclease